MTDIAVTRMDAPVSLTRREKWRELFFLSVIAILSVSSFVLTVVIVSLYQQIEYPSIQRSDDEMIDGGRRFIDYFYSINSATVGGDQFRAISMMIQDKDKYERIEYLISEDFIRRVEDSRSRTEIDWTQTTSTIIEREEGGVVDVEYKAYLARNGVSIGQLDILVRLVPVAITDSNTTGVGVWAWKDIAENPFEVRVKDES